MYIFPSRSVFPDYSIPAYLVSLPLGKIRININKRVHGRTKCVLVGRDKLAYFSDQARVEVGEMVGVDGN